MESKSYSIFNNQLEEAIKAYPSLAIKEKAGKKYLNGILDVKNEQSTVVGSYLVEIHHSNGFPYRFPVLFETGGDIPNEADWHKYRNGACCLTVLPDEILKCRQGITVVNFISKYYFSFLANHIYYKEHKRYLNGEYSHGAEGLRQFYSDLFKNSEITFWRQCIDFTFYTGHRFERNDPCFCQSNSKFKNCHLKVFDSLKEIGIRQVLSDVRKIYLFATY